MELLNIHKTRGACESCGHEIVWAYVVKLDTGATTVLGSDCARALLGPCAGGRLKKIASRAANQWRSKKPAPQDGEDRGTYIERRVAEMLNARAAWQVWRGMATDGNHQITAIKRLRERGITDPYSYDYGSGEDNWHWRNCHLGSCSRCRSMAPAHDEFQRIKAAELEAMQHEVEDRYHANRWDFTAPVWTLP